MPCFKTLIRQRRELPEDLNLTGDIGEPVEAVEIWRCDLNGENAVKLYEVPYTCISSAFWIENDTMYTYADFFDPETGENLTKEGDWVPVAIDLKTGEVTVLSPEVFR